VKQKLIALGWVDVQGRSLPWQHWQEKRHRQAVSYWRDESRRIEPIYNVLGGYRMYNRGTKAA